MIIEAAEEWYTDIKIVELQQARDDLFMNLAQGIFHYVYEPLTKKQKPDESLIANRLHEGVNYLEKIRQNNTTGAFPDSLINDLQEILKNGDWGSVHGIIEMSNKCRILLRHVPTTFVIQKRPKIHER